METKRNEIDTPIHGVTTRSGLFVCFYGDGRASSCVCKPLSIPTHLLEIDVFSTSCVLSSEADVLHGKVKKYTKEDGEEQ
jgi:hypothetical protein